MADEQIWRDPTAANFYADDQPALDSSYGGVSYRDALSLPMDDFQDPDSSVPVAVRIAAAEPENPEPETAKPARPASVDPSTAAVDPPPPPAPSPAPPPAPQRRAGPPRDPRPQSLRRPGPTVGSTVSQSYSPQVFTSTTTAPTDRRSALTPRPPRSARPPVQPGQRRKSGGLGWVPAVVALAVVLFLANGGVGGVKHLLNRNQVPSGAVDAVTSYYAYTSENEAGPADTFVCTAKRSDWLAGDRGPSSDVTRRATLSRIVSKKKSAAGYEVVAEITTTDASGSSTSQVTLTVISEDDSYALCDGTNP